jgi:outer membrane immunogenic protein
MKKRLLAASCLVSILVSSLAINAAAAADLAARPYTKAPAVAAAVYNWTGFYLGANAGYGWGHSDEFAAVFGTRANFDISGGLAGGQVGYNWQAGAWVFGVEADGDWADIDGAVRCPNPAFSCTAKVRDLASFRGRVGWATGPVLLYATGGLGYANVRHSTLTVAGGLPGTGATGVYTADRWGYAIGAGLEYGFAPSWSAKLEYMHYGFDDITSPGGTLGPPITLGLRVDTVKAGVNYHFGWGGPAAAKY